MPPPAATSAPSTPAVSVRARPLGSDDSTPFSWSPSPRPFPFPLDSQPPTSTDSVASQASVNDPFGSGAMTQGGKRGRGSRGGKQSPQSQRPGGSGTGRDYNRWDKKRESDGFSAEGSLVDWLAKGGWKRWKDAKSTGHKDKCCIDVSKHLDEDGFDPRSKDAIAAKIRAIEDSFKKALTWLNSTGAGSYSLEPEVEGDGRSPYQRELDKRCKYYNALAGAFGERAGLRKWDFEEENDNEDDGDNDEQDDEDGDEDGAGRVKKRRRVGSANPSCTSRSGRPTGIVKFEDISAYLASKGESDNRRLALDEKKLKLESKKARAEAIAIMVKAGLSIQEAKQAWEESDDDSD
ncbi:hypothetical protein QFC24_007100 [Naganishia onofrii]|uniref:Uncharacterized protein n=1 Tax=Naganishia onofrii TaxID=1851511 RepID=A0ACC2WUR7_9TREE|nr:hypothetical protein QFC24_007100 [Naganishia onofrii]